MNSLAALTLLLQRAEKDRDTAIAVLRQAEAQVQQALAQAAQLESYRGSYDQQWTTRFQQSGSGTPELLHCKREFGLRLDHAIAHQHTEASHLGNRVQRAQEALLDRERRVAAVRKLIERRQHELRRMADKRDQRATDEAAQRARAHPHAQGASSAALHG